MKRLSRGGGHQGDGEEPAGWQEDPTRHRAQIAQWDGGVTQGQFWMETLMKAASSVTYRCVRSYPTLSDLKPHVYHLSVSLGQEANPGWAPLLRASRGGSPTAGWAAVISRLDCWVERGPVSWPTYVAVGRILSLAGCGPETSLGSWPHHLASPQDSLQRGGRFLSFERGRARWAPGSSVTRSQK